jgi:NAD(P)H dehydrogenase (quinone)
MIPRSRAVGNYNILGGVPEGFAPAIAGWDAAAAHGALFDNSRQLSSLIGHPTTSLATVIADAVKSAK